MKILLSILLILLSSTVYAYNKPVLINNYIPAIGHVSISIMQGSPPDTKDLMPATEYEPSRAVFNLTATLSECTAKPSRGYLTYTFIDYPSKGSSSYCTFEYYYIHYKGDCRQRTSAYFVPSPNGCSTYVLANCHPREGYVAECSIEQSSH